MLGHKSSVTSGRQELNTEVAKTRTTVKDEQKEALVKI